MKIPFTKMHGLGNDFVLIDCRNSELGTKNLEVRTENSKLKTQNLELGALAEHLCHRRFGIGADQILLLLDSEKADFRMRIFNADGSEVEMCGNGIRCFAKYIWDSGLSDKKILAVETLAGIVRPEKAGDMVKVDMGEPVLEGRRIPVNIDGMVKDFPLKILGKEFKITCVSMGNPHAVIVLDDIDSFEVGKYGPVIENHELFPNRINVEFIQVVNHDTVKMRVWERGAGETMACGTGASAAAVAANLKGLAGKRVNIVLLGGELLIEWKDDNHVYMTGPAVTVFEGVVNI